MVLQGGNHKEEIAQDESLENCYASEVENGPARMSRDRTPHKRARSARKAEQGGHPERSFLLKLGCLTEQGERLPFQAQRCAFAVSEEHTITGFQEGEPEEEELAIGSMIEVNHTDTLSLEPEAVGRVLGIDYAGLRVPLRLRSDHDCDSSRHIRAMVLPGKHSLQGHGRHRVASFNSDFQDYVNRRNEQLYLPGAARGIISSSHAYCLAQEMVENVKWNWAKVLVFRANAAFRGAPSPHSQLSSSVSWFLSSYISEALRLLGRPIASSIPSPAAAVPRGLGIPGGASPSPPVHMASKKKRGCSSSEEPPIATGFKRSRSSMRSRVTFRTRGASSTRQAASVEKRDGDDRAKDGAAANLQQHTSSAEYKHVKPGAASNSTESHGQHAQEEEFESIELSLRQTREKTTDTAVKGVHGLTGALEQLRELNALHRSLLSDVETQKRENWGYRTEVARLMNETYKRPGRSMKKCSS